LARYDVGLARVDVGLASFDTFSAWFENRLAGVDVEALANSKFVVSLTGCDVRFSLFFF